MGRRETTYPRKRHGVMRCDDDTWAVVDRATGELPIAALPNFSSAMAHAAKLNKSVGPYWTEYPAPAAAEAGAA